MKHLLKILLLILIANLLSAEVISREENFEFAEMPTLATENGRYVISFTTQAKCDVTVSVRDRDGNIIRHLASGVLGSNAPAPFVKDSLHQRLVWDLLDDQGNIAPSVCQILVSLGLNAEHEMDIGWKPVSGTYITKNGSYFRTLFPPPAETPENMMTQLGCSYATTLWGDRVPYGGWSSVLADFSKAPQALTLLTPLFSNKEPSRKATPYPDAMCGFSAPRMAVDPRTEDLYVSVRTNFCSLNRINGVTGQLDTRFSFSNISEFDVGPDSLIYMVSGEMGYGRYLCRVDRDGHVVPFPDKSATVLTSAVPGEWYQNFPHQLNSTTLTEVIPTGVTNHSNIHEKGFDVSLGGRMVGVFDMPDQTRYVKMWETSGKLISSAVVNSRKNLGHGVRVDRDNNLYLVEAGTMPAGQTKLDGIADVNTGYRIFGGHGSLIKYADKGSYPLDAGSLWVYGGMTDQMTPDCSCNHSRYNLDGWARSWIPARQLESVMVLDANGNRIVRVGRYGNVDDEGLRFAWVRSVAVSDKALYANDEGNRRIQKGKLIYENEVVINLDGTVQLSPGQLIVTLRDAITQGTVTTLASLSLIRSGVVVDTVSGCTGLLKLTADSGSNYTVNVSAAGYLPTTVNNVVIKGSQTTRIEIAFTRQALAGINIQPDTLWIPTNTQSQLSLYGVYADGAVLMLDSTVVPAWTSLAPEAFSVSNAGLASSNTLAGAFTVVSNIASLGLSDSAVVRIFRKPLENTSFETPTIADHQRGPIADATWVFNSNAGIQHNGGAWGAANAPDGVQTAFLQNTGFMTQNVFLETGSYKVRFQVAKRTTWGGQQTLKVYLDSVEIGEVTPMSGGFSEYVTAVFSVSEGTHQLKIAGVTTGDNSAFVDIVAIVPGDDTGNEATMILDESFMLAASPNPFNPSVTISVSGFRTGAELKVFDVTGKVVANLTSQLSGGSRGLRQRQVSWNASDHASGVYILVLRYGKVELKRKILLVR